MAHSTRPKASDKAAVLQAARKHKHKDKVPLLAHATMRWGRKINGRIVYFGKIDGNLPDFGSGAALGEYHRTVDDLRAGRTPRPKDDQRITLGDAVNRYLTAKAAQRDSGELAPGTWTGYHAACAKVIEVLGKHRAVADLGPDDFRTLRTALAKGGRAPVALAADIRRARTMFRFCLAEELIDRPPRYGTAFDLPTTAVLRLARAARGLRMFEPEEIRLLLDHADTAMTAAILLGVNCGFGQTDLARLPKTAIKSGWITYPRPKTGIDRRCPLWAETAAAVNAAIAIRPEPKDPADDRLVFLTPTGLPLVRQRPPRDKQRAAAGITTTADALARRFWVLMKTVKLDGGRGFYALRHGFQTIAEQTGDFPAIGHIMGHADASMAGRYRERFDDDRLQRVVDHVHAWLFGEEEKK